MYHVINAKIVYKKIIAKFNESPNLGIVVFETIFLGLIIHNLNYIQL